MLEFKTPQIEDKAWVDQCFKHLKTMNCDYTFGNMFVWSTEYSTKICMFKDFFICSWGMGKETNFGIPVGKGDFKEAVEEVIKYAKANDIMPRFYGVTEAYVEMLNENFPDAFQFSYDDGYGDYIYEVEKMASLKGKKYHGKRNHITNFKKNNPNWSFETINKDNIDDCINLHAKWINTHVDDSDISFEFEAVLKAFENYDKLGFIGGIIRIDGEAVAYTFGEPISDETFVTHFEKAPPDIQGAYPIINQEFTKNCLMNYKYVNREEDLGLEGLRKAKQSYCPEIFLKKCIAVYKD